MPRILIADDDAHMVRLLSIWFRQHGHDVVEARNGHQARQLLEDPNAPEPIDLIVSDINMPVCDGIALVKWLRNSARRHTPIILLSSRCDQMALMNQLSGLDVVIQPKPFSPSRLMGRIEHLLGKNATR